MSLLKFQKQKRNLKFQTDAAQLEAVILRRKLAMSHFQIKTIVAARQSSRHLDPYLFAHPKIYRQQILIAKPRKMLKKGKNQARRIKTWIATSQNHSCNYFQRTRQKNQIQRYSLRTRSLRLSKKKMSKSRAQKKLQPN